MDTIIAVTTEVRSAKPTRKQTLSAGALSTMFIAVLLLLQGDLTGFLGHHDARPVNARVAERHLHPNAHLPTRTLERTSFCPTDMVLVEGTYCSDVVHQCNKWLDDPKLPFARCGEYEKPATCRGIRENLRFCIDREEYTRPGEALPQNQMSLNKVERLCQSVNKRLCEEREWNFACEGEEMRPYPYGWTREPKCNQDRTDLTEMRRRKEVLRDLRRASSELPECVSPFGVHNLVGNLDEPVLRDGTHFPPMRTALKGGWWMPGRNRCRPATTAHDDYFEELQIGARCCADPSTSRQLPSQDAHFTKGST